MKRPEVYRSATKAVAHLVAHHFNDAETMGHEVRITGADDALTIGEFTLSRDDAGQWVVTVTKL